MLSPGEQAFVRAQIDASEDKECLKLVRTALSRVDQPHTRRDGVDQLTQSLRGVLNAVDQVILTDLEVLRSDGFTPDDIQPDIKAGLAGHKQGTDQFFLWLSLQRLGLLEGRIEKGSELRQQLSEVKRWVNGRITALTPTTKVKRRGTSARQRVMRAPSAEQIRGSQQLKVLRANAQRGIIDVDAIETSAAFVGSHPDAIYIFQLMLLLSDARRVMDSKQAFRFVNRAPAYRTIIEPEQIVSLSRLMLRMQPDTVMVSAMMVGLSRLELYEGPMADYGDLIAASRYDADCYSLGNGLWSLARHEVGRDNAALLAEELCTRIEIGGGDMPNRVTTVSSLWACGVFDLDRDLAAEILDYARALLEQLDVEGTDEFHSSDVAKCFQASVYFEHDQAWWRQRFEKSPALMDSWYQRSPEAPEEVELLHMVQGYLRRKGLTAEVTRGAFIYGLECDVSLLVPDGPYIDLEYDGKHHLYQRGSDAYRDGVFKKLGDITIRIDLEMLISMRHNVAQQDFVFASIGAAFEQAAAAATSPRRLTGS